MNEDEEGVLKIERDGMALEVDLSRLKRSDPKTEIYQPVPGYTSSAETPPSLFRHVNVIQNEIAARSGLRKRAAEHSLSDFISLSSLGALGGFEKHKLLGITPALIFKLSASPSQYSRAVSGKKARRIILISGVHAREWFSQEVALSLVSLLTRTCISLALGEKESSRILEPWILKADLEIIVVPVVNLFGYFCTLSGPLKAVTITKSPSQQDLENIKLIWGDTKSSGHTAETHLDRMRGNRKVSPVGVDINRNYPHHWGNEVGASRMPLDDDFCGIKPASEPETQAIINAVNSLGPDLVVDLHSYGNDVLKPGGLSPDSLDTSRYNVRLSKWITVAAPSIILGLPLSYRAKFIYPISGCLDAWLLSSTSSSVLTMEIGGSDFSADSASELKRKKQMPLNLMNFFKVFYFERPLSI